MSLDAWLIPPRGGLTEWIDRPETPWRDVLRAMRDVQRVNRLLGTYGCLFHQLERLAVFPADRPLRVLDVATGLADVPRALVDWARRRHYHLEVVGLDLNARILTMAADTLAGYPDIRLVQGDALALPFADGSFDWALCHLALHHFPQETYGPFLRELDRVIRPGGGLLVGDLLRSRPNYAMAWIFLNAIASPIGRHDGLVSILNALSAPELDGVLKQAGLGYLARRRPAPPAQFVVAGVKPCRHGTPDPDDGRLTSPDFP